AGLVLAAQPLVMACTAPFSGSLSDRVGSRPPATVGMVILGASLLALAFTAPTAPLPVVALLLACAGLGIGLFASPNNSALMGAAPRGRQGIASAILATARNVGMVLGVGAAGAILTTQGHAALAPGVQLSLGFGAVVALAGSVLSWLR
ncbi:MAG TPA: MFS transporter, partial [Deinococcales bacterium]|nr:MFS transporter [Deinococcales bacterium]